MNIFHIRNLGWYPEDIDQVYGENKDMVGSIRTIVNMIRYICCTFFKMPASRDVKFVIKKTKSRGTALTRSPSGPW